MEELHRQTIASKIPFEIIVVDDCSTDKIIQKNNSQIEQLNKCKLVINENNKGRTETRSVLSNLSKYDNLLFLDADVMPKKDTFIAEYAAVISQAELIFGGIIYKNEKPDNQQILRWKYGHSRESISQDKRAKDPYISINSGCFLINKCIFNSVNEKLSFNHYGLDNLFKQILEEKKVSILHIDNPVYHLGLEKSSTFIKKSLQSIETTVLLENKGLIQKDLRPIQKSYLKAKRLMILPAFRSGIRMFEKQLVSNFKSKNPSLFLFDLYRLYYYDKLKRNA